MAAPPEVAVVDFGLGNLFSVKRACEQVGLAAEITSDKGRISSARALILPGVGSYGEAMEHLERLDLIGPIKDFAASGKPLLGICLGLQLLLSESREFGRHKGLGLIEGEVVPFENPKGARGRLKVPQVCWNRIFPASGADNGAWSGGLLKGIVPGEYFYFVHSFYARPENPEMILSETDYGGIRFCSAVRLGNITAFQFHPERSGPRGLAVYSNLKGALKEKSPD